MSMAAKFEQKPRHSRHLNVPIPFDACDPSGRFVLVGYAHEDKALAYPELLRIRSLGIQVWYDEGIEPGSEWPEAIANALKRAAAFVVLITPAAVASRNVRNEISLALSWGKPFFAIHLVRTELPPGLELQMGVVQAIMRWQMDDSAYARKLGKALASYAETTIRDEIGS
jgi:TIR domain